MQQWTFIFFSRSPASEWRKKRKTFPIPSFSKALLTFQFFSPLGFSHQMIITMMRSKWKGKTLLFLLWELNKCRNEALVGFSGAFLAWISTFTHLALLLLTVCRRWWDESENTRKKEREKLILMHHSYLSFSHFSSTRMGKSKVFSICRAMRVRTQEKK